MNSKDFEDRGWLEDFKEWQEIHSHQKNLLICQFFEAFFEVLRTYTQQYKQLI